MLCLFVVCGVGSVGVSYDVCVFVSGMYVVGLRWSWMVAGKEMAKMGLVWFGSSS